MQEYGKKQKKERGKRIEKRKKERKRKQTDKKKGRTTGNVYYAVGVHPSICGMN
jgi:hypothetical protein